MAVDRRWPSLAVVHAYYLIRLDVLVVDDERVVLNLSSEPYMGTSADLGSVTDFGVVVDLGVLHDVDLVTDDNIVADDNTFVNDATHSQNGVVSYFGAVQDHGVGTDDNIVADDNAIINKCAVTQPAAASDLNTGHDDDVVVYLDGSSDLGVLRYDVLALCKALVGS